MGMSDYWRFQLESADPDPVDEKVFSMQQCLIFQDANNVLRTSKDTLRALRSLRQSLLNCEICPAIKQCELRENFNVQVDLVIAEINEEWGW
jgi:hypothetical protein